MTVYDFAVVVVLITINVILSIGIIYADKITARGVRRRAERDKRRRPNLVRRFFRFARWLCGRFVMVPVYFLLIVGPFALIYHWLPTLYTANREGVTLQDAVIYRDTVRARRHFLPEAHFLLDQRVSESHEQKLCQEKLKTLFPNEADYKLVILWGGRLLGGPHWKGETSYLGPVPPRRRSYGVSSGTDGESAVAAWNRIVTTPWVREDKLASLATLIPLEQRAELMSWAETYRARMEIEPPNTDWFRMWIIYEVWCPDEASFARRKVEFVEEFGGARRYGRDVWTEFVLWGKEVAESRRKGDAGFPAESDRASVVAAVDRLTGRDDAYAKAVDLNRRLQERSGFKKQDHLDVWPGMALASGAYYPNDDVPALYLSTSWMKDDRGPFEGDPFHTNISGVFIVSAFILWGLLTQRGMRLVTTGLLGRILRIRKHPHYQSYLRAMFSPGWQLLTMPVVLAASWYLNRRNLESFPVVYCQSEFTYLGAMIFSGLMGGVFVEVIETTITAVVIRLGGNPETMIWDNLVAICLGVGALYYFQNSWTSIGTGVMLGIFVSVANKIRSRSAHAGAGAATRVNAAGAQPK